MLKCRIEMRIGQDKKEDRIKARDSASSSRPRNNLRFNHELLRHKLIFFDFKDDRLNALPAPPD